MAADPNPSLRAELMAALAVLDPQIRGLHDLVTVSISEELRQAILAQITVRERRRTLILSVLSSLDSAVAALIHLENDGYPALPEAEVASGLFDELQGEETDLDAAVGIFVRNIATKIVVTIGDPVPKA